MKTLYKNGTIIDGTGEKPYIGDVLTDGDRILSVGEKIGFLISQAVRSVRD